MSRQREDFLTLYVDPGETTGWCVGKDLTLLAAGQTPMWEFADDVWEGLNNTGIFADCEFGGLVRIGQEEWAETADDNGIGRIVMEDWRLYPEKMKALAWDQCRTARLIGALTFMGRVMNVPVHLQPAAIKDRAVKGAAEELFYTPLHENRHQNDAIMHFTYFTQVELLGLRYSGLDNLPGPAGDAT